MTHRRNLVAARQARRAILGLVEARVRAKVRVDHERGQTAIVVAVDLIADHDKYVCARALSQGQKHEVSRMVSSQWLWRRFSSGNSNEESILNIAQLTERADSTRATKISIDKRRTHRNATEWHR